MERGTNTLHDKYIEHVISIVVVVACAECHNARTGARARSRSQTRCTNAPNA